MSTCASENSGDYNNNNNNNANSNRQQLGACEQ